MANIRVTPETLNEQGNDLIGYAGDLQEILDKVNSKVTEIINAWDGLAQDAYYELYTSLKESLDKFPGLVYSLGTATVNSAEAFATTDETLKNEFNKAAN